MCEVNVRNKANLKKESRIAKFLLEFNAIFGTYLSFSDVENYDSKHDNLVVRIDNLKVLISNEYNGWGSNKFYYLLKPKGIVKRTLISGPQEMVRLLDGKNGYKYRWED